MLFADVVHSMDIAAAVGPERLREIMAELFDRSVAIVRRYDGTVDKFTGDGIMAVFGAPVALEDHALRACMAALEIQAETAKLAAEVDNRDGVELQLRVGLNSGQVITGEIGSSTASYTAIGEQVGMAQRMESAAPPGGVMLSGSTARLVENLASLEDPELVAIKGADAPVPARRLLAIGEHQVRRRSDSPLVGRTWELNTVTALLDEAVGGAGSVVTVVGPPGIGKSRLVRETVANASGRGIGVFTTYCESHTTDIPFHVVARLLRATTGIAGMSPDQAREHIRTRLPQANPEDLLLVDDLLGIGDPDAGSPDVGPDARRRRLTALVSGAALAQRSPTLVVIEDAHWIDAASESMLADFMAVSSQVPSLMLITYRSEYRGALSRVPGAQTIALRPSERCAHNGIDDELVGAIRRSPVWSNVSSARAAGNPFFAEEMVRDLAERGVMDGQAGAYLLRGAVDDVDVPANLQSTIGARIDRLPAAAKKTLNAASVIGLRFDTDLLDRARRRCGHRSARRGRDRRSGGFRHAGGVRVQASADPRRRIRVAVESRACATPSKARGCDRGTRCRRRKRGTHRTAHGGSRRICTRRSIGTCAPRHGRRFVTSLPHSQVGYAHAKWRTVCPMTIRTSCRCAYAPRALLCAP